MKKNNDFDKTCDRCRHPIYYGEDYYEFEMEIICQDCIVEYIHEHKKREAYPIY